MRIVETALPGVLILEPDVYRDARGYFLETFHQRKYAELGIPGPFVQDNHSFSYRGTLRGLHAQLSHPQGKLVRALEGEVFDVAADIRVGSPTFGRWACANLSGRPAASSTSRRGSPMASARSVSGLTWNTSAPTSTTPPTS